MRWIIQFLPLVWNSAYLPWTRSPWKVTITSSSRHLSRLVGAAVPDLHLAGAVLALRDLAGEVDVVERVVLDVHREVVALGVGRDALRHRPRDQHAVALEAQVPVQVAGVVLLHHEALARRCRPAPPSAAPACLAKSRFDLYSLSFCRPSSTSCRSLPRRRCARPRARQRAASPARSCSASTGADHVADDAAAAVDEERLRDAGGAVAVGDVPRPAPARSDRWCRARG